MRIAFDGRPAQRAPHSYRRVLQLIVAAAREMAWDIRLWTDGELHPDCVALSPLACRLPPAGTPVDVDVLWSCSPSVPVARDIPSVAMVFDVNPLLPDGRPALSRWRRRRKFLRETRRILAENRRVVCSSEDAKERLCNVFPACSGRIGVVPLYAAATFGPMPVPDCADALKSLGLETGYVLCVGSFRRHKNWHGLMRAYARLSPGLRDRFPLVYSGPVHRDMRQAEKLIGELGIGGTVHILGETREEVMPALYAGAAVFAFPSFMEGFGLPPLEAMACGVPVLSSNRTSLPEVLGDAPRYVDPADPDDLAGSLRDLLENEALRCELASRSRKKAAEYGVRRTGEAMAAVLSVGVADAVEGADA